MVRTSVIILLFVALLSSGCAPSDPSPTIRARFQEFGVALVRDDVDSGMKFLDPVFIRAQGGDKLKGQLRILSGLFKLGKMTEADLRVDQVIVAEDRKSAEVRYSLQSNGEWKPQKPSRWVLSDGQWYIQI